MVAFAGTGSPFRSVQVWLLLTPEALCISIRVGAALALGRLCQASMSFCLRLLALSFVVALPSSAWCQAQGQETEIQFDIPAQPLDAAVENYVRITGLQVLYNSSLTSARFSTDVRGRFTRSEALRKLLAGTSLTARYTIEGAFTILPVATAQPDAVAARQIAGYDLYLGTAQRRVVGALCKTAAIRLGDYRAAVQFSISQSGFIEHASLLDTTGDPTLDRNVVASLRGLPIGQAPPTSMPQPITMLVTPRAPGSPDECGRFSK